MKAKNFKQLAVWRLILMALSLLFSSLSPALALSVSQQDICEMACCVAEGHCCCATRKPWVKGQKPDDRPIIEQIEITAPSGCLGAPPSSASNIIPREIAGPAATDFHIAFETVFSYHSPQRAHHFVWFTPTPPRAPPSLIV